MANRQFSSCSHGEPVDDDRQHQTLLSPQIERYGFQHQLTHMQPTICGLFATSTITIKDQNDQNDHHKQNRPLTITTLTQNNRSWDDHFVYDGCFRPMQLITTGLIPG